ncbi:hypothetical protein [Telluribacter sp. SYSU D00476]|uniref:hypothetical protein n=1 Tax=Telluribacter sp. SYSU D00476 TaxID=2811430 RepID=UPI001FF47271|nr:hypothetical protein [Telluribacter sp. SYSU D00476]
MQNERLYNKIRHIAHTETPSTEEWNPDRVWAKVEKRRKKGAVWLWLPVAAASVLVVLGLFIGLSDDRNESLVIVSKADKVIPIQPLPSVALPIQKGVEVVQKRDQEQLEPKENLIANPFSEGTEPLSTDTAMESLPAEEVGTAEVTLAITDTVKLEQPDATSLEQTTERVLVAYISIPEQRSEELSALRQMYDQVKQDREARKMRTRLSVTGRKPSLWSFVHHSFVEYPSYVKPVYAPTNK